MELGRYRSGKSSRTGASRAAGQATWAEPSKRGGVATILCVMVC